MRAWFNRWRRQVVNLMLHRHVFGERSQGRYLPHTRISPTTYLEHEDRLVMADHIYIGPFCWLEASGGITLGEGVQITSHVSIVTHSSHRSLRLMGRDYAARHDAPLPTERPGWLSGPVQVGAFSFIGPHVVIEANSHLGRGSIVRAGSVVRGRFPDHAVLDGRPAVVVGDAREGDQRWLDGTASAWRASYQAWVDGGKTP